MIYKKELLEENEKLKIDLSICDNEKYWLLNYIVNGKDTENEFVKKMIKEFKELEKFDTIFD